MKKLSALYNRNLMGEIVIVRVDLNINNRSLKSSEANLRITSVIPTVKFLTKRGAKVVLVSHRGRPQVAKNEKRKTKNEIKEFTLKPFAKIIGGLLKKEVAFISLDAKEGKIVSGKDSEKIKKAAKGSVFLLENIRFLPGEDKNDQHVVQPLAELGTFYVNDAFAVSHRKNASVAAITKLLPSCAGLLLEKEVFHLDQALHAREHPFVVILGGAKMTDKMGLIKQFIGKADYFLAGGGIANTMFAAEGLPIGDSVYEQAMVPFAKKMLKTNKIIVPMDVVVSDRKIVDNGRGTTDEWIEIIKAAKTIIWNGPLGVIEDKRFAKGSIDIAKAIAKSKAFTVVGGGETALAFAGIALKKNVFLSTGGGAMLEYLSGIELPGVETLREKGRKK
jgi:3-phosphoglycerate kinase